MDGAGQLIEAVPNFSAGADARTVEALLHALASGGAQVADVHLDADHDRSVFTLCGTAQQLEVGLLAGVRTAVERIDLREQRGVHPRVGACDVVPIVPLGDLLPDSAAAPATDCHALAARIAQGIGALGVPAIRYGRAARGEAEDPAYGFAGAARAGGSAGLARRIADGGGGLWAGPRELHETAGATICGVRDVLIAGNVVLADGAPLELARSIAATIRERGGGLLGVRALGIALASRERVQVSFNAEHWRTADARDVLDVVRRLAREAGSDAAELELVGLAPSAVVERMLAADIQLAWAPEPRLEFHVARIPIP